MNSILSSTSEVREPSLPRQGEDVREPPLPSNNGSKDELPSEEEKIDPDEGGGREPRRVRAGARPIDPQPYEILENNQTGHEPKALDS